MKTMRPRHWFHCLEWILLVQWTLALKPKIFLMTYLMLRTSNSPSLRRKHGSQAIEWLHPVWTMVSMTLFTNLLMIWLTYTLKHPLWCQTLVNWQKTLCLLTRTPKLRHYRVTLMTHVSYLQVYRQILIGLKWHSCQMDRLQVALLPQPVVKPTLRMLKPALFLVQKLKRNSVDHFHTQSRNDSY